MIEGLSFITSVIIWSLIGSFIGVVIFLVIYTAWEVFFTTDMSGVKLIYLDWKEKRERERQEIIQELAE